MDAFDIVIIGAGQAGIPLARRLAESGKAVALAERRHLGGSCVNFGCTPTKAVLASARVARLARRGAEFGLKIPTVDVDLPAVMRRARRMVADSRDGLRRGLEAVNVTMLTGHARFTERGEAGFVLDVAGKPVTAKQVVLDTGTRASIPEIAGLAEIDYLHAGNWLGSDVRPQRLVIVGASYIGLEMAQFYRATGAAVCVIGPHEQALPHEDADVADALTRRLKDEGIKFKLGNSVKSVRRHPTGDLTLTLDHGGTVPATHLFVATGRQPNTDDLGLGTIGLTPNGNGTLAVDERLATTVPGVWAAGDIRGGPMFTHAAWDDHRVLESQLLFDKSRTTAGRIVPYAVFTDPELGRVGLTETQARQQFGDAIKVTKFEMKHNGRAEQEGETAGFIKLISDPKTDRLIGVAIVSASAGELIGSYITLMNAGATLTAICRGIYVHPTLTEAVQSAAMA